MPDPVLGPEYIAISKKNKATAPVESTFYSNMDFLFNNCIPLMEIDCILFNLSSTDGHWSCFWVFTLKTIL